MSIAGTIHSHKSTSVVELAERMEGFVREAAREGRSLHDVEQHVHELVYRMGNVATGMFIALQGDGDLGKTVMTEAGVSLHRSADPVNRPLQTVFGLFNVQAYVYARSPKKKIELRPVDARMELPPGHASYLFEEFSQYFCVEQAFDRSVEAIDRMMRQSLSKETLERINRRVGHQAEQYLDELAAPPAESEGELMILTGDGKGVPLVKPDLSRVPIFDPDERRGNRRMATLASVYTVDRFVRTPSDIVASLFRDPGAGPDRKPRPKPADKQLTARFARERELGEGSEHVSGPIEAFSWASRRIADRLQPDQPVVVLMDGAPSQWDAVPACLDPDVAARTVEILDIIHVSQYVWRAAKVFYSHREHQEAFARERLERILSGGLNGVIAGLRRMSTTRQLRGTARSEIGTVCRYFENNASRMRYHEYLSQGYPIATGVIEGACRYLVKDRMERSGMRWSLAGAQPMLHVRAIHQSPNRADFHEVRILNEQTHLYPHKSLVSNYQPCQV
ncbi:MAG: ISKra4 family transposase [Dehalococcoidia bacterium]|jgi:hypothetical protein|nr:ISKra4 family transposase [Dehalococcoidia bacterium]